MEKVKKPFYKRWWFWAIIIIIVIGALGSGGDDTPKSGGQKVSDSETKNEEVEVNEEIQTEFKLGEIISYKQFDLIFDNKRELKDLTGSQITVFDVSITSKEDDFKFFGDIQGVTTDNEVIDDTIAFTDEDLGDPIVTSWTKTLNTDQKAKGYVAFDKDINKIEVRSSMFKNDVITIVLE